MGYLYKIRMNAYAYLLSWALPNLLFLKKCMICIWSLRIVFGLVETKYKLTFSEVSKIKVDKLKEIYKLF
jgi:hypothetical protein